MSDATSFRQEGGDVHIGIGRHLSIAEDVRVPSGPDVRTLLQVTLCAIKNSGDAEHIDLARKITKAWLP